MKTQLLEARLEKLRAELAKLKIPAVLISDQANRYYLTGWDSDPESGYLLISAKKAFIITDSRYTEEAVSKVPHFELREFGREDFWQKLFTEIGSEKVGFEAKDLSIFQLKKLKQQAKVSFVPTIDLVEKLRLIKDSEEVRLLQKAATIGDKALDYMLKNIQISQTEREIAWELEKAMKSMGAEKNAWDNLIVAVGDHSSMAHYAAGDRKVAKGSLVLLDFGCVYQGYHSDMTRVIFIGEVDKKQQEVYEAVLSAQSVGISLLKSGVKTADIDKKVREGLEKETKFTYAHGLGHGVGLQVHESPSINFRSKEKLTSGNVVTVEPGIYEPGWGGVRIEDMVLVKDKGAEVLTKSPKKLEQIIVK